MDAFEDFKKEEGSEIYRILTENKGLGLVYTHVLMSINDRYTTTCTWVVRKRKASTPPLRGEYDKLRYFQFMQLNLWPSLVTEVLFFERAIYDIILLLGRVRL